MNTLIKLKYKLPSRDKRLSIYEWPAYLLDIYRVFPRTIFILASIATYKIGWWYMYGLLAVERTAEVSAFVAVVSAAWIKLLDYYMQRGVDWSKRMQINGGEQGNVSSSPTGS